MASGSVWREGSGKIVSSLFLLLYDTFQEVWFTVGDIPFYVAEKSVVEKSAAEVTTEKTTAEKSTTEKAASEKAPEVKAAAEEIALEKDVIVYEIDRNVSYAINPLG